jgi:hypothetical protein
LTQYFDKNKKTPTANYRIAAMLFLGGERGAERAVLSISFRADRK